MATARRPSSRMRRSRRNRSEASGVVCSPGKLRSPKPVAERADEPGRQAGGLEHRGDQRRHRRLAVRAGDAGHHQLAVRVAVERARRAGRGAPRGRSAVSQGTRDLGEVIEWRLRGEHGDRSLRHRLRGERAAVEALARPGRRRGRRARPPASRGRCRRRHARDRARVVDRQPTHQLSEVASSGSSARSALSAPPAVAGVGGAGRRACSEPAGSAAAGAIASDGASSSGSSGSSQRRRPAGSRSTISPGPGHRRLALAA